jgi:hypothetical protein
VRPAFDSRGTLACAAGAPRGDEDLENSAHM